METLLFQCKNPNKLREFIPLQIVSPTCPLSQKENIIKSIKENGFNCQCKVKREIQRLTSLDLSMKMRLLRWCSLNSSRYERILVSIH